MYWYLLGNAYNYSGLDFRGSNFWTRPFSGTVGDNTYLFEKGSQHAVDGAYVSVDSKPYTIVDGSAKRRWGWQAVPQQSAFALFERLWCSETQATSTKGTSALNATEIQGKRVFKTNVNPNKSWSRVSIPINFSVSGQTFSAMRFCNGNSTGLGISSGWNTDASCDRVQFIKPDGTLGATPITTTGWNSEAFADATIDFGDIPQEIPLFFYNWLMENTTAPKTARITIKSFDGSQTLAQSDFIAPFSSLTINRVGNTVTVTTNTAEQVYFTLTDTDKEFAGLSTHALSVKPLLRTGRTSEYNVEVPVTFYECYGAIIPVPSTYGITFYHSSAEPNRCDKTDYLTSVLSLTGTLREGCSVMSPAFNIIADDEYTEGGNTYLSKIMGCNYCYIPKFGRYYFITDISNIAHNVWRVAMSCDVLHTFWGGSHGINTLQGVINRTADGNYVNNYIQDNEIMTEVRVDRTYNSITNGTDSFNTTSDYVYNILLQTFGDD